GVEVGGEAAGDATSGAAEPEGGDDPVERRLLRLAESGDDLRRGGLPEEPRLPGRGGAERQRRVLVLREGEQVREVGCEALVGERFGDLHGEPVHVEGVPRDGVGEASGYGAGGGGALPDDAGLVEELLTAGACHRGLVGDGVGG